VKAVVLRVDSPGGSAFASDEIWRALEKLKEEGKPYVVSMGGLAASGGYYVSAGATAIYANPSTITGSIGVYSGKYDLEGLFDRIGIETELYNRGRRASMWSLSKPMDDSEFAAMDRLVGETYAQFKERVGDGRKLKPEQVEEVARGRVWSGSAASGRGLVDELGGFHAAVERARKEAGITERQKVELITYGSRPGPDGELPRRDLSGGVRVLLPPRQDVAALLPPELALLRDYQRLSQDRIWALSPYSLEIK
jgi:protease-4